MKKLINLSVLSLIIILLASCSGQYGSREEYKNGQWKGYKSGREAHKDEINRQQEIQGDLAIAKLKSTSVKANPVKGYEGVIENKHKRRTINVTLRGPEVKSFALGPGQRAIENGGNPYLLPGKYTATFESGGYIVGKHTFDVGVQTNNYQGEEVHWFLYYDPY